MSKDRFDTSITYLRSLNRELADQVSRLIVNPTPIDAELSLRNAGYYREGSKDQHKAVRALLLCMMAYFRPPHIADNKCGAAQLTAARSRLRPQTKDQIDAEIMEYVQIPGLSRTDLVNATARVNQVVGSVDTFTRRRTDTNVSSNPVCYHGVSTWLFSAGFVSKRWLGKEGSLLTGYTANTYLGLGDEVPPDQWDAIPPGYIFNIHKKNDPTTCHWGVTLANGKAVGCNNTGESVGKGLTYDPGGRSQYGIFAFKEICSVLNVDRRYRKGRYVRTDNGLPFTDSVNDRIDVGIPGMARYEETDDPSGINIVVRRIDPVAMASSLYY